MVLAIVFLVVSALFVSAYIEDTEKRVAIQMVQLTVLMVLLIVYGYNLGVEETLASIEY